MIWLIKVYLLWRIRWAGYKVSVLLETTTLTKQTKVAWYRIKHLDSPVENFSQYTPQEFWGACIHYLSGFNDPR